MKPKYSILQYVDGYNKGKAHHQERVKYQFRQIHFEAIDYYVRFSKEPLEEPMSVENLKVWNRPIESLLLSLTFKHQPYKMIKHTQRIRWQQPTNSLSVFDHFVGLAFKGIRIRKVGNTKLNGFLQLAVNKLVYHDNIRVIIFISHMNENTKTFVNDMKAFEFISNCKLSPTWNI